ncbi:MAG: DUF4345 domain-containing protein [Parvularculaceae bacterium]
MREFLKLFVALFGAICILISLAHIAFGHAIVPGAGPVSASTDNEDRFFATLFLGFGAALVWCSRDLDARGSAFKALLAIFLLGGLARLLSIAAAGLPHPLFIFLTGLELILPGLLLFWFEKTRVPAPDPE